MKNYDTLPNTAGAFPAVVALNSTGPGATDGTAIIKQLVDDQFGSRQAVMDAAGLVPNAVDESATNSQFLQAMIQIIMDTVPKTPIIAKNWRPMDSPPASARSIGFARGFWLAPGVGGATEMNYSVNAHEWEPRTLPTTQNMNAVFGNASHAAVVGNGGEMSHATDPTAGWTDGTGNITGSALLRDIHEAGGFWVICDDDGFIHHRNSSTPAGTFTRIATPASAAAANLRGLHYVASLSLWIVVGEKNGSFSGIMTATDPSATWTERTNPIAGSALFQDIDFDGTNIVICGGDGVSFANFIRSTDGITYVDKSSSLPDTSQEVTTLAADPFGHTIMFQPNPGAPDNNNLYYSDDAGGTWLPIGEFGGTGRSGCHYEATISQFAQLGSNTAGAVSLRI